MVTPLEKLDREINLYVDVIDARRDRDADCIDHVAHLELLYVQRAAMVGRHWPSADDLDDAVALLEAEPPPLTDVELAPIRNAVSLHRHAHRRVGSVRRWLRSVCSRAVPAHGVRVYASGGLGLFR